MNINLNIPIKLLERFITAIEQLAQDYRTVHAHELYLADSLNQPLDKTVGRTYYQSDRAVWEAEQKAKALRAIELGEDDIS